MGTSTVSGPFRSANGFQELVDGVWTPVSGGGGGGGLAYQVINRVEDPQTIVLPENPATGDTYLYMYPFGFSGSFTEFTSSIPGTLTSIFVTKLWGTDGSVSIDFGLGSFGFDGEEQTGVTTIEIVYSGTVLEEGDLYATYAVTINRIDG